MSDKKNWVIGDLHIHSRFSRACSSAINFENLVKWAKIKGLQLLGTGDFTHPAWLNEIKDKLIGNGKGFYYYQDFPFVISGEISLVYTQERGRRIHLVILVPDIETAEKINSYLDTKGRRDYDGRPIFKISGEEFVSEMIKISKDIEIIPAHCLPGDSIIHSNHSFKKIKDINEGDLVYTHNNNWKKVIKVYSRKHRGKIYKIKPWCWTEGLESTSEHPFYAIKSFKCSWIKGLCKESCSKLDECKKRRFEEYLREWVPASELSVGDFLVYPRFNKIIDRKSIEKIRINPYFCKLLGYYLAEGYTIRKEGIGFSFSKEEEKYAKEVIFLMNEIFGKSKFKIDERKGRDIIFYSKKINKFFSKFYNSDIKRANTKHLLDFMLELPLEKQIEIFKGWYRGDKGYTVSRELINQMKIICLRLGIIPNIYKDSVIKYKKRGNHFISGRKINANHDLYSLGNLSFFEDKFNLLREDEFVKFKTKISRRHGWIDKNYVYLPIRKIEIFDYNDYVYNLEVGEDNSYVSEFACVHNCWTPWFGLFGSMSGFDSLKECFGEQIKNVHAIETGMSSDPAMNWRIKEIVDNNKSIVSFSDAHSFWPFRLGREATIFRKADSYHEIVEQIRNNSFIGTIETNPAYGKYHFDGHRICNFSSSPEETRELNGVCPVCGKKLTIGVEYRVEELAQNPIGFKPENAKTFYKLLPLHELIALITGVNMQSKKVWNVYNNLIKEFGNEFEILLAASKEEMISKKTDEKLIEVILKNRDGEIKVKPGFDGEYGKATLEEMQKKLF
ncbi:MAG: hypothetical protein KKF67_03220 [Nanoarchaeota archaeon]|nr:hypothetical protein [Nanoarchaeota archaeon]